MTPQHPAIYALTQTGATNARRLHESWPGAGLFLPARLCERDDTATAFNSLAEALIGNFRAYSGHLVFAASGIVVRVIAPLLRGKDMDPAVVVLDQEGRFAVSLVSGHLGGANRLAQEAARILGGTPVITTATDTAGAPSLDVIAQDMGYGLDNLPALAAISRGLLEGSKARVWDPEGWLLGRLGNRRGYFEALPQKPEDLSEALAWVGPEKLPAGSAWLGVRPPCLALGVGCNRDTPRTEIFKLLESVLAKSGMGRKSIAIVASAEAKRDEPGLLEFAAGLKCETVFYQPEQLNQVEVPRPSEVVLHHMGTKSVCEAAAILASSRGTLIAPKAKTKNVTMALARIKPPASFT